MADEIGRWPDDRLVSAAVHDPEAFGELYRRHVEAVLAFFLHRTRSADTALDLTALVGDLSPGEREAVLARVVDEQDYREIAAAIGCTESAVRTRVSRGLARLVLSAKEQER